MDGHLIDVAKTRAEAWRKASEFAETLRDLGLGAMWGVSVEKCPASGAFYIRAHRLDEEPPALAV